MKRKKGLANILRSTVIAGSMALPAIFGGCEKDEDITPPKIIFVSPTKGITYYSYEIPINWHIADDNFKSAWYSIDNGSRISIPKSGSKEGYFENGYHKIVIGAEDLYLNSSKDSVIFYVNAGMLIYPFTSPDANGAAYNVLTTKTERDAYIQQKLDEDWTNEIPYTINPLWVCGHYAMQLNTNSRYWGEGVRTKNVSFGTDLLYNGYKGRNIDSIKINNGTLVDMGDLGLPMGIFGLSDVTHSPPNEPYGHAMNWILTGDDLTKWEDYTIIEPQNDMINLQPGEGNIPYNCDEVTIDYEYVTKNNFLEYVTLVKFKIENGNPILVEINEDPKYNIIKHRQK
ncbi:MAG: hypothetical protein JXA77_13545 [Bacteroidales bacterium]|nr:hypothetical protein [Bacteroidales bacterium]